MADISCFYSEKNPDIPQSTVSWRIYELVRSGVIQRVGRGIYRLGKTNSFQIDLSIQTKKIARSIKKGFPYTDFCVWEMKVLCCVMLQGKKTHVLHVLILHVLEPAMVIHVMVTHATMTFWKVAVATPKITKFAARINMCFKGYGIKLFLCLSLFKVFILNYYFHCWNCNVWIFSLTVLSFKNLDKLSINEQYELMKMIDDISNHTRYLMHLHGGNSDLKVIMQWIRNLNTNFSNVESLEDIEIMKTKVSQTALDNRNRDIQMAENIDWIFKNYPQEKLIVWCANFHGAKDISQTCYPADPLLYFTFQSMGEFLHATQGEKMYSLAFTSLQYSKNLESGTLETEIAKKTENAPFAFINYESLRFADGYRDKEFDSSVIVKKRGKWMYIFDGLYYIRDQHRE